LIRLSIKAEKTIKRASILAGQLEEASLFLIMIRKEKAIITPKTGYTICRLMTPRV